MSDGSGSLGSLLTGSAAAGEAAYRVLARKYRPHRFDDLIGQEAMVRTLSNAFALGRIHQAYLLCGVRGVGKTTTARILARALNYHGPGVDAPAVAMPALGTHCQAIIESRHIDVIEIDAASHTGIDDIREIIDGVRYRPALARYKVYIIDEVHMLSKAAFNGLLKTLEEPPEHVKFLFATTESEKVPVTVRSRCQRFDLRRIETPALIAHLAGICASEGVAVGNEALALIARAAEGSVRDALSLLDQAIAHGGEGGAPLDAALVRAMLGVADTGRVIDLFEALMRGEIAAALTGLKMLHDAGADPVGLLAQLADFVHLVTRIKLVPDAARDPALIGEERDRGLAFAERLSVPVLTRAWQLLSRGLEEVRTAPRALAAADMVLVRIAHVADLPTPDEAIRRLATLGTTAAPETVPPAGPAPLPAPVLRRPTSVAAEAQQALVSALATPLPRSLDDVRALAVEHRDILLQTAIERDIRPVRFEPGLVEFEAMPGASPQLAAHLMRRLNVWTGTRWMVSVVPAGGAPTMRERGALVQERRQSEIAAHPVVARILELFPGSRILAPQAEAAREDEDAPLPDPDTPAGPVIRDDDITYTRDDPGPEDPDGDDL